MSDPLYPAVFYFTFDLDPAWFDGEAPLEPPIETDEEGCAHFVIHGLVPAERAGEINDDVCEHADWFAEIAETLESEFGVHNWISSPDERVVCLGAYHTYEVPPRRVQGLLQAWHKALSEAPELSGRFAPPVQLQPAAVEGSDFDIWKAASEAAPL